MTKDSESNPSSLDYPELIIGLVGPIGVDIERLVRTAEAALRNVDYRTDTIKLTEEVLGYPIGDPALEEKIGKHSGDDTFNAYMRKMSYANALREKHKDPAFLARLAIIAIRRMNPGSDRKRKIRSKHAYIIRQLKRPEEVSLLRRVYGRQFILIAAYTSEVERKSNLCDRLRRELSTGVNQTEISHRADLLIDRDANEDLDQFGQKLRDTFHLADVFVNAADKASMNSTLTRFTSSLFGRCDISPSKREYGMYAAKSASLRSVDLSRQVGAAIFSSEGELITQGCNEVPKAGGGTYWDLEEPDNRDIKKGSDPNERHKIEMLRELIERLRKHELLSKKLIDFGTDTEIVESLIASNKEPTKRGVLVGSKIMDLTEYGRVVHAEMSALLDAARLGRSVKGATLFCTTFPCHNCTKHLLASGIKRVVYIEPYPKSMAKQLHPDEVEIEQETEGKLSFLPFLGISPYRYRDLFQKGRRKHENGSAYDWDKQDKRPLIDLIFASYIENEIWAISPLLGVVSSTPDGTP